MNKAVKSVKRMCRTGAIDQPSCRNPGDQKLIDRDTIDLSYVHRDTGREAKLDIHTFKRISIDIYTRPISVYILIQTSVSFD